MLESGIQLLPGSNQDITIRHDSFCRLNENEQIRTQLQTLFITENEINFLTFPEVNNSMVLFGSGYGFEFLSNVLWLAKLNIYYWGDIDTHGFAILNQLYVANESTGVASNVKGRFDEFYDDVKKRDFFCIDYGESI